MSNLLVEETFEGSTYFPNSGTAINKIRSYENCNPSKENTNGDIEHGTQYDWTLMRVANPVYQGIKGVQFEIRKDQPLVGGSQRIRSEVVVISGKEDSRWTQKCWYGISVNFPTVGQEPDLTCSETLIQWWEDGGNDNLVRIYKNKCFFEGTKPSNMSLPLYDLFKVTNSVIKVQIGYGTTAYDKMVDIPKDKYYNFTFLFNHSYGSDGLIEIWRNGVQIYEISGCNMHAGIPKFKIGLYKPSMPTKSTRTMRRIYIDNVRVGNENSNITEMLGAATQPTPPPLNKVPICRAGDDIEIVLPANEVVVVGVASDPDGTITQAVWTQTSGPGATIANPLSLNTKITGLKEGVSIFKLSVTDNDGANSTDELAVTVLAAPPVDESPITGFKLINAGTEKEVASMVDGGTYDISQYGPKLNIKSDSTDIVAQVRFELSGQQSKLTIDKGSPFSLWGDNGQGNYYYGNWNPPAVGSYRLVATPFDSSGNALQPSIINFSFVK
jgi:hypothetical protein